MLRRTDARRRRSFFWSLHGGIQALVSLQAEDLRVQNMHVKSRPRSASLGVFVLLEPKMAVA